MPLANSSERVGTNTPVFLVSDPLDYYPHACIASGRGEGEFIDTGQWFEPNPLMERARVYLARGYVEQLAREHLGMVAKTEVAELQRQVDEFKTKLTQLEKLEEALA